MTNDTVTRDKKLVEALLQRRFFRNTVDCSWNIAYWNIFQEAKQFIQHSTLRKLIQFVKKRSASLVNTKGVFILHDNGRPRVTLETPRQLQSVKRKVLPHPRYRPDLYWCKYFLFFLLSYFLFNEWFNSVKSVITVADLFFNSKNPYFFPRNVYICRTLAKKLSIKMVISSLNKVIEKLSIYMIKTYFLPVTIICTFSDG